MTSVVGRAQTALDGITSGEWIPDGVNERGLTSREHADVFAGNVWGIRIAGLIPRGADAAFVAAAPGLVRDLIAEIGRLQSVLVAVAETNDAAGAHRFDFDTTAPHPTGEPRIGGPDNFYNGCNYAVRRIRRVLTDAGEYPPRRSEA